MNTRKIKQKEYKQQKYMIVNDLFVSETFVKGNYCGEIMHKKINQKELQRILLKKRYLIRIHTNAKHTIKIKMQSEKAQDVISLKGQRLSKHYENYIGNIY